MKRQDGREVPHEDLLDELELAKDHESRREEVEFGGKVRDGDLRHALRVFKDRSSGVVRLEASALRGPMADVPLWTAFVSKYAHDPDWAHFEGDGIVSLAAMRPPPYVFLSGYQPPKNKNGEFVLQFTTRSGECSPAHAWNDMLTRCQMRKVLWKLGLDFVERVGNRFVKIDLLRLCDMWD